MCHLGYMGQLHNYYRLLMGWGVTMTLYDEHVPRCGKGGRITLSIMVCIYSCRKLRVELVKAIV
jgi:hypothetical protein